LILHFKWSTSVSLACDTTFFTVDEIGRVYSTYAGTKKCTQNFLFFKLSMPTLTPTKLPAPGTLPPRAVYPGYKAYDSYPFNANIKNTWRYSSTPLYAFKVCTGTSCYLLSEGVKTLEDLCINGILKSTLKRDRMAGRTLN
jgi:hypothetical protein